MGTFFIGNDTAVITMLLLFITGILTKRFVPWWVYDDVVEKLKEYEEAAPELITEVQRLMTLLESETTVKRIKNPRTINRESSNGRAERKTP